MGTFTAQLKAFQGKTETKADTLVGAVVVHLADRIDKRTPVGNPTLWKHPAPKGYVGGRARGEWQLGVDSIPAGLTGVIDPSGVSALGSIIATIPEKAAGHVYYLANNLPYAQALEDGHSSQAPSGMVGLTVIEFPQIVAQAAAT